MADITDTTVYPNTTPALADHVPGTDVSDTGNSVDGEVVTFTMQAMLDLFQANLTNVTVTGGTFSVSAGTITHATFPSLELIDQSRASTEYGRIYGNEYGGVTVDCDPGAVSGVTTNFDVYTDGALRSRTNSVASTYYGDIIIEDSFPLFVIRDTDRTSTQETRFQGDADGGVVVRVDPNNVGTNPDFEVEIQGTDVFRVNADGIVVASGSITEATFTNATATGSIALEPNLGTIWNLTLTGNVTFTDSLANGESLRLIVDDGTGFTITWPTAEFEGGTAPTLATTGHTIITVFKSGGTLFVKSEGDFS